MSRKRIHAVDPDRISTTIKLPRPLMAKLREKATLEGGTVQEFCVLGLYWCLNASDEELDRTADRMNGYVKGLSHAH